MSDRYPSVSDDVILNAMLEHPVLVSRPIVCTKKGVALCRPSDAVFALLDIPQARFSRKKMAKRLQPRKE